MRSLAIVALALIAAAPVQAQDSTCSYDRCAIWLRDGRLVVGMPGERLHGGGDALLRITTRSDSARWYARNYVSRQRVGIALGSIGLFGALSYFQHSSGSDQSLDRPPMTDAEKTWMYGSLTLLSASLPFIERDAPCPARRVVVQPRSPTTSGRARFDVQLRPVRAMAARHPDHGRHAGQAARARA